MNIEELRNRIREFDKKVGWDKTTPKQLMNFIQEELDNLKQTNPKDDDRINHLLADLLVLVIQTSYRYDTDFKSEIEKWFKESEKHVKLENS